MTTSGGSSGPVLISNFPYGEHSKYAENKKASEDLSSRLSGTAITDAVVSTIPGSTQRFNRDNFKPYHSELDALWENSQRDLYHIETPEDFHTQLYPQFANFLEVLFGSPSMLMSKSAALQEFVGKIAEQFQTENLQGQTNQPVTSRKIGSESKNSSLRGEITGKSGTSSKKISENFSNESSEEETSGEEASLPSAPNAPSSTEVGLPSTNVLSSTKAYVYDPTLYDQESGTYKSDNAIAAIIDPRAVNALASATAQISSELLTKHCQLIVAAITHLSANQQLWIEAIDKIVGLQKA